MVPMASCTGCGLVKLIEGHDPRVYGKACVEGGWVGNAAETKKVHSQGHFAQMLLSHKHGMGNREYMCEAYPKCPFSHPHCHPSSPIWAHRTKSTRRPLPNRIQHIMWVWHLWWAADLIMASKHITNLLWAYFPWITSLYQKNKAFWLDKTNNGMEYGLFFNLAINMDMEGTLVKSKLHWDLMNLAFGVCIIIPFGQPSFSHVDHPCSFFYIGYFPHSLSCLLSQPWNSSQGGQELRPGCFCQLIHPRCTL